MSTNADIRKFLLHEWDPIGVLESPEAWDEYDSYIDGIYQLLASGADVRAVAEHLLRIENVQMDLWFRDIGALLPVAERLVILFSKERRS
jgi:N-acyl-D-aspartate/D-glutamate deacylase